MKISFVGGGVMCEALVAGILKSSLAQPEDIIVSEPVPDRRSHLESQYRIVTASSNADLLDKEGMIVIAVHHSSTSVTSRAVLRRPPRPELRIYK